MPALDALHAEMALRGVVAGLLLFHAMNLALPGPRPAARLALIGFVMSVLAYLFCQQAEVLRFLPRPLAYGLVVWCVAGAAWLWVAARALFDDNFRWSVPVLALLGAATVIGLSANLPYSPDGDGPYRTFPADAPVVWVGHLHLLLPALHVLGIGTIALGLALLVARRSLSEALGFADAEPPLRQPLPAEAGETGLQPPPVAEPANDKVTRRLQELERAMTDGRAYRREGLGLSDLAQTTNMSEATRRELINQRLGLRNFNDFLHHHRLREATERLSREDLPILTIALECGYGSIGPFNRAFKQRLGVTPTEFRAMARLAHVTPGSSSAPPPSRLSTRLDEESARLRDKSARLDGRDARTMVAPRRQGALMSCRAVLRNAFLPALRSVFLSFLAVLTAAAQAATGLAEIKGPHGQELVAVFYPTASEGPPVQRWQFSLPVVEQAPPALGNGRLVVISHGSPSNPWMNADLAIALTRAGFIVAAPWHSQRLTLAGTAGAPMLHWTPRRRPSNSLGHGR